MYETIAKSLHRLRRRLLLRRCLECCAVGMIVGALLAAAGQACILLAAVWGHMLVSRAALWAVWLPVVLIPAIGLAWLALRWMRGVTLAETAAYIDRRCALAERLTTAAEQAGTDTALARYANREASLALSGLARADLVGWRRTRTTPAILTLALVVCLVLASLGGLWPPAHYHQRAVALVQLSPHQRVALIDRLEQIALVEADDPRLADAAAATVDALSNADAEALARAMARLEELDAQARDDAPNPAGEMLATLQPGQADHDGATASAQHSDGSGENSQTRAMVYSPGLEGASAGPAAPIAALRDVPATTAWQQARARATTRLQSGQVPPEYRPLVRAYFAAD